METKTININPKHKKEVLSLIRTCRTCKTKRTAVQALNVAQTFNNNEIFELVYQAYKQNKNLH